MKHLIVAVAALLASSAVHSAPLFRYVVTAVTSTDLGTLGGNESAAADINNTGNIVGWAETISGEKQAFYYPSGGAMLRISPGGTGLSSEATGINSSNTVVGTFNQVNVMHGFRWQPAGSFLRLSDAPPGGGVARSSASAISNSGLIAGQSGFDGPTFSEATLWLSLSSFDPLDPDARWPPEYVNDVNSAGDAVGVVAATEIDRGQARRWRWTATGVSHVDVPLAGPAEARCLGDSDARGINRTGTVVGYASCHDGIAFRKHAIHWNGTSLTSSDLGLLPAGRESVAEDINDAGFTVGYGDREVRLGPFMTLRVNSGFLFHPDFGMYALPPTEFTIPHGQCRAIALNERNANGVIQVVGHCVTALGTRAVRWDVTVARQSTLPPGTTP